MTAAVMAAAAAMAAHPRLFCPASSSPSSFVAIIFHRFLLLFFQWDFPFLSSLFLSVTMFNCRRRCLWSGAEKRQQQQLLKWLSREWKSYPTRAFSFSEKMPVPRPIRAESASITSSFFSLSLSFHQNKSGKTSSFARSFVEPWFSYEERGPLLLLLFALAWLKRARTG